MKNEHPCAGSGTGIEDLLRSAFKRGHDGERYTSTKWCVACAHESYAANSERKRERSRQNRLANPERGREWSRQYRRTHPERLREWRKNNPGPYRAISVRRRAMKISQPAPENDVYRLQAARDDPTDAREVGIV